MSDGRWQEAMHDAIAGALRDHGDSSQSDEVLTSWVLVAETRDVTGDASIGFYRGPRVGTSWLHEGMLATAMRQIAAQSEDGDE